MKTEFTVDELRKALKAYIESVCRAEGVDFINQMADPEMERIVRTVDEEEEVSQADIDAFPGIHPSCVTLTSRSRAMQLQATLQSERNEIRRRALAQRGRRVASWVQSSLAVRALPLQQIFSPKL